MYKGYKITKRLQRYMEYISLKYERLSLEGEVNLWDIISEYKFITDQPECVQMFIYDCIYGKFMYYGEYSVVRAVDGGLYVKKIGGVERKIVGNML